MLARMNSLQEVTVKRFSSIRSRPPGQLVIPGVLNSGIAYLLKFSQGRRAMGEVSFNLQKGFEFE